MHVLPLQSGIIYGIVRSRRLKSSLGINLSPTDQKLCSFNCVYCHYGCTEILTDSVIRYEERFPTPKQVEDALRERLQTTTEIPLYITFSGNGEPSMHTEFVEIVDRVIQVKNDLVPEVKTAILSNSSTAHIPEIRDAILKLDTPIMKLDAGDVSTFRQVNRPARGVHYDKLTEALAGMAGITIQTCLFTGSVSNSEEPHIASWIAQIARIDPREVQVYTVDRPPADSGIQPVPPERLAGIVERATLATGIPVRLFGPRQV